MAVKIFLTGATGYIGGSVLYYIYNAHHGKEFEYSLLVRDQARAEVIKKKYPDVKIIFGTLEDSEIVEKAASEADIVIHTADSSDNVPGATAIAKGLKAGHSAANPGYWLHLSGTGILTWFDDDTEREGEAPLPEQKYYDVDGIDRVRRLPPHAWHKNVDDIVQSSISDAVQVAIICPPTIYGVGLGECIKSSDQIPNLARYILIEGHGPIIGNGETEWDNVHIDDLCDLYVKLFNAYLDPERKKNPEIFGHNAYYFAGTDVHNWADITKELAALAGKPTKVVSLKEVKALKHGRKSWGQNSCGVAQRATQILSWQPKGVSLQATLPEVLEIEKKALGLHH